MHEIKAHPDGLCASCQVPQSIEHILLDCTASQIPVKLKDRCTSLQILPTLPNLLSSTELQDLVFDLVLEQCITL